MNHTTVHTLERANLGSAHARRLRKQGYTPINIYGESKAPIHASCLMKDLVKLERNKLLYGHILTLQHGKSTFQALVKHVHTHPIEPLFLHIDFQRIHAKHPIETSVALILEGEDICPANKQAGQAIHFMTSIQITCLPKDLPDNIRVNIAHLTLDETLHLQDIPLPKGVSLGHGTGYDTNPPVIVFHAPKVKDLAEPRAIEVLDETDNTDESQTPNDDLGQAER